MIENLQINGDISNDIMNSTLDKSPKMTGYASLDKPWKKYYERKFSESEIPDMSIYQLALLANKGKMKNTAIDLRSGMNDYGKGIKISYKTFFKRIIMDAKASSIIGVKTNEIVPFILPNVPEARILVYSSSVLGSTTYPVSPLMPENQLEEFINLNEIKNLFIFEAFYEKYSKVLKKTNLTNVILLDGSESLPNYIKAFSDLKKIVTRNKKQILDYDRRVIPYNEYIKYSKNYEGDISPYYDRNHIAAIIGTSGTTGLPKGVCLSDRNINTAALAYKNGKVFEGSMMDALLPSIGYGISMMHYQTVDSKYIYLIPELLTDRFPEALCKIRPENFPGGPVHYIILNGSKEFKEGKIQGFRNLISGGASLPNSVESSLNNVSEGYKEQGVNDNLIVRQGYGLSENVALGTYSLRGSYAFGSIGIPMPYLTFGIFKPDTDEELKYGEVGELCITGPSVMVGYLNNDDETDKVIKIHKDGKRWIHTKDIAYMDEDGHVFHVDRIKNIFMRTGFNVHPAKIAEFINTIDFVKNSVVIGFNHPKEVCVPIAFVQLDESLINGLSDEKIREILMNECFSNLEETSVPYDFVFTNDLPINLGGKIDIRRIEKESEIDLEKGKIKRKLYFH